MKNTIYSLLTAIIFAFSISAFAQTPPPPNGNGSNPTNDNTPVGGGAPIGGGLIIFLALGTAYGSKKVYDLRKKHLED